MTRWWLLALIASCGDNLVEEPPPPPRPSCNPPPVAKPTGKFSDPTTLGLPDDCVRGGLANATGRWFVVNPHAMFELAYPEIAGTCELGFHVTGWPDGTYAVNPHTLDRYQTWSDGTYLLAHYDERRDGVETTTQATAYCLRSTGELAAAFASDTEGGSYLMVGTRFDRAEPDAEGLELVGRSNQNSGFIAGVELAVDGDELYLAGYPGLVTFDVHDPAHPIVDAATTEKWSLNDVAIVHGDGKIAAYVSSTLPGAAVEVYDVTNPKSLHLAARTEYAHTLTLRNNEMYFATYTTRIPIYDVTHPLAPVPQAATTVPVVTSGVHDMWLDGTTFYTANLYDGLYVFDTAASLAHPTLLGRVPSGVSHSTLVGTAGGRRIVLHSGEGWLGDQMAYLQILDGDPSSPTFLTELAHYAVDPRIGIHNYQLVGDRLYIAYYQAGVRVVDLADPTHPREVAHYTTWPVDALGNPFDGAYGIQVRGDLIYVADSNQGLLILRDPALATP